MTDHEERETESHIATDRDRIREWADEAYAHPIRRRREGSGSEELAILPESEHEESHDRMDWDQFFDAMDRDDKVVVFHGTGTDRSFEVVDQDRAVGRSALEDDDVEQALKEGETVTTNVTQATVVEQTVVEHADIESELIGREHVDERYLDAELVSREVIDCTVTDVEKGAESESRDYSMFETGAKSSGDVDVEVEVDIRETWSVTKEMIEQVTVESRVTDVEVTESDTVESTAVDRTVNLEDVERTILDSGMLESHDVDTDAIDRKAVESEYTEDDAVVTELMERTTIDEELSLRRRFRGDIDEAETTEVETVHREAIESEIVEADEYEIDAGTGDADTTAAGTAGTTDAGTADAGATARADDIRVTPERDDMGKKVFDETGEELGIVSDVKSGSLYIDPHPSLTDRIRARLDWGDRDEESYPIEEDKIDEITGDRVILRVDR